MTPHLDHDRATVIEGDCVEVLRALDENSVDAVVTDPPYGIHFMGKTWDQFTQGALGHGAGKARGGGRERGAAMHAGEYDLSLKGALAHEAWAEEVGRVILRVLKPGGHLLWFGSPRAHHRAVSGLENAGFEIRDSIHWIYGTGFPKSLNLGDGRGTALKPGHEPIVLARKPLIGTVAENVERYGTGALNIDGCRLGRDAVDPDVGRGQKTRDGATSLAMGPGPRGGSPAGRWPANVVFDEDAAPELDAQSGILHAHGDAVRSGSKLGYHGGARGGAECVPPQDRGGASRFFYCAKPARSERDFGCDALPSRTAGEATDREEGTDGLNSPRAGAGRTGGARNFHPTVKPVALMRWLCRLVTPPGGIVLDPFLGSGTTGIAALREGLNFIGIERSAEYLPIALARVSKALEEAA